MAGFISDSALEQIRAASDIVDVIGSYLPLKKASGNFKALCPFHKEKSPSFNVNPSRQTFYCFGCHKGGDVFTFVKEYENISFVDAVKRLADRANIILETEKDGPAAETRHIKDTLLQIHEQITQRWQNALANDAGGQIARDYLDKRGVSPDAVKLFRLGYAPEAWDDTVNWAKSKNFDVTDVEKAGLVIHKEETDRYYDRFRGRLMFPICDEQGRVIGFSGRVLSGDEKTAKYVNSPETPIFTKSKVFFGLDKSKRAILDAGHAIVCEGQLDLIACYMAGVKNIVAPQGTAFTSDHARIIKRYVNEVVLCFDSDNAGQNAAVRSLDSLLASGLAVRVAVVPSPHDPDSFIKENGGEAFANLIRGAKDFFDYYLDRLCDQNDWTTEKGRQVIVNSMGEALHKTGNAMTRNSFAQKTALRLGVDFKAAGDRFKRISQSLGRAAGERSEEADAAEPQVGNVAPPSAAETWLLKLLISYDDLIPWAIENVAVDWVEHDGVRTLVDWMFKAHSQGTWGGAVSMLNAFEQEPLRRIISEAATSDKRRLARADILGAVMRLRNDHIEAHRSRIRQNHANHEMDDIALLKEEAELNVLKRTPIAALPPEF